jgi:Domain of unknown function (DUF4062)
MKKVFISSTYLDLEPTRKLVADIFNNLEEYSVIQMENFPSDAMEPNQLSAEKLKESNIFVLIIGHKYGTIPYNSSISITHNEYREAVKMLRKNQLENIFVFIATDDFRLRSSDIEEDFKRQKLREFKAEITHTYRYFSNEKELDAAIHQTLLNKTKRQTTKRPIEIFQKLEDVKNLLDRNITESKQNKLDRAMESIIQGFDGVFKFDNLDISIEQPILSKIRAILNEHISNVVFVQNQKFAGRIDRWGIRHVIFRADTVIKLMQSITDDDELREIGKSIGQDAAIDLFRHLINPGNNAQPIIPGNFGAFVELLNYWDSSGGWGTLKHLDENEEELKNIGIIKVPKGTWMIRTENNFLAEVHNLNGKDELDDIRHLYKFWEGYIHGALNVALKELEKIYTLLPKEYRNETNIPPYILVTDVKRAKEDIENKDYFAITFQEHQYVEILQILEDIKLDIEIVQRENRGTVALNLIVTKISSIVNELKKKDGTKYSHILNSYTDSNRIIIENIASQNQNNSAYKLDEIKMFEELLNTFVRDIIHFKK